MTPTQSQLDRIGNLLVYITRTLGPMPKTKLLKLIYIIEEESVKKAGVPFTCLDYTWFKMGPVATYVNNQIDKDRTALHPYITWEKEERTDEQNPAATIYPVAAFDASEFSPFDMELINGVLNRFASYSTDRLIEYTHREGSLWKRMRDEHGGMPTGKGKRDFDLSLLLNDADVSEEVRQAAREAEAFKNYLTAE